MLIHASHQDFERSLPKRFREFCDANNLTPVPGGDGIIMSWGFTPVGTLSREEAEGFSDETETAVLGCIEQHRAAEKK